MSGKIEISRELGENIANYMEGSASTTVEQWHRELRSIIAAPVVERQPVASGIAHDKAYRNGMMAGFSFGIRGDEDGYAKAVERYDAEIHAAKTEQPAPVAVVLPERREPTQESPYLTDADHEWNDCLDKVKELNS